MKKEEFIRRYGEAAYEKMLQQTREWRRAYPEEVITQGRKRCRKGGKYYERHRKHESSGLRHRRNLVRNNHRWHYGPYKQIIAPDSQLHHQWVPETADYTGVALVETDQHMHGFVDVIQILEGEITLLTEVKIQNMGGML